MKKGIKKLLAGIVTLTMLTLAAVPAFAATTTTDGAIDTATASPVTPTATGTPGDPTARRSDPPPPPRVGSPLSTRDRPNHRTRPARPARAAARACHDGDMGAHDEQAEPQQPCRPDVDAAAHHIVLPADRPDDRTDAAAAAWSEPGHRVSVAIVRHRGPGRSAWSFGFGNWKCLANKVMMPRYSHH